MSWITNLLGTSAPAVSVPANFEPPKAFEQTPITEFRHGSQAWDDLFGPTRGLAPLTEYTAASVTAIYACVNLIAGAIATLPFNLYRVNIDTGERDQIFHDDLIWVFNEEMSARWLAPTGWEFLMKSLLFEGDGFAIIGRDRMHKPVSLEPIHPFRVQNTVTSQGRMVYGIMPEILPNGVVIDEFKVYDQDDILHFPGFGFNGLRGMSPLRHALRSAGAVAHAAQEFSGRFFVNGARPDYALSTDQQLGEPRIKELQTLIDERHRSVDNAHRPMLLHSGLKMTSLQISQADMQLLAQRQFQVEEIARAYGVPPFMIGHNEKTTSWGSGVAEMSTGFVRYTLRQHLNKCATEINRKIFRTAARAGAFDTTDLEQADPSTLATSLRTLVGRAGEPRIISPDEARASLRRKRMGGDAAKLGTNEGKPSTEPDPATPKTQGAA